MELYNEIKNKEIKFAEGIDSDLMDLLNKLLCKDPLRRIGLKEIIIYLS